MQFWKCSFAQIKYIFKINIYWKKSKLRALEIADIVDSSSF